MPDDLPLLAESAWNWLLAFLPRLLGAATVLVAGLLVARYASRAVIAIVSRAERLDRTAVPVAGAVIRYAVIILTVVAALGQLGVQTASMLAILGAAGLAIGLALQGTLSNIAAGLMLLWLRPFRVGDFIETGAVAGTVEEINLFNARIRTWDGVYKFVPNSGLWNTTITNYTRNPTRLVLIECGITYGDDLAKARDLIAGCAARHSKVLADPAPVVVPLSLGANSVVLQLRAWTGTADFWDTRWDLTQGCRDALAEAGITMPPPQYVVQLGDGGARPAFSRPASGAVAADGGPSPLREGTAGPPV